MEPKQTRHQPLRVGIYGASGTTGIELVSLLFEHPNVEIVFATSRSYRHTKQVDPAAPCLDLCLASEVDTAKIDVAFLCLPHGTTSAQVASCLERNIRVIDLSGGFRLHDAETHQQIYACERSQHIAENATYGLTEFYRSSLPQASLVANPGCYATCVLMGLAPLLLHDVARGEIVIQALSGVSGAGRSCVPQTHFCAVHDNVRPYKLGKAHRHIAEMKQTFQFLAKEAGATPSVIFCPHVVPLERGMLATMVVDVPSLSEAALRELYHTTYKDDIFVEILPQGEAAQMRAAIHTNKAVIGLHPVEGTEKWVVTCAIDNLGKGAAGQAIQNMNVMFGIPERTALSRGLSRPSTKENMS